MTKRRGKLRKLVGRPIVYRGKLRAHILSLIRRYGLTGAKDILNATDSDDKAELRSSNLVPSPLGICFFTLQRLARSEGMKFKPGRPKKAA